MEGHNMNDQMSQEDTINVPKELSTVNSKSLEEYVAARIKESLMRVQSHSITDLETNKLSVSDSTEQFKNALQQAVTAEVELLSSLQPRDQTSPIYMLTFSHKCLAIGCTNTACDLCESNPRRGCTSDFGKKYFKGDLLKAKCGGSICIELWNKETGNLASEDDIAPDTVLELCIVDGNKFDQLFPQGRGTSELTPELQSCMLLHGNGERPLLRSEEKALNRENGMVIMPLQSPQTNLCDLAVHCSSEALLSGRRPPFRLIARLSSASHPTAAAVVSPAMSTSFIVASGRSRLSQKKSIPFLDDPVSRLENMGKERIKKLRNLHESSRAMQVELPRLSCWEIITVADFQRLAFEVDTDGQVKQKLLHMLKMSEKAWEESRDHAASAITNDTRMRAWYRPNVPETQGLAYVCYLGEMEMERPVALLLGSTVILKECLDPMQRHLMKELQAMAAKSWWQPNHPDWTFFDFDSEVYKKDHRSLLTYGIWDNKNTIEKDLTPRTSIVKKNTSDTHQMDDRSAHDIQVSSSHSSASHRQRKKQKKDHLASGNLPFSPGCFFRPWCDTVFASESDPPPRVNSKPSFVADDNMGGNPAVSPSPPLPLRYAPSEVDTRDRESAPLSCNGSTPRIAPVVPRPPPDSAFVKGYVPPEFEARGRKREEAIARDAFPRPVGVEDSAVLRQFLMTSRSNEAFEGSSSGTGDNYHPPQQPAVAAEQLKHLLQGRGLPNDCRRDGREGPEQQGLEQQARESDVLSYLRVLLAQPALQTYPKEYLLQLALSQQHEPKKGLNCSIDSLSSHCKAVMSEEDVIRQLGNVSNQDLNHSFEAGMLDQLKQRQGSGSPGHTMDEGERAVPSQELERLQLPDQQGLHGFVPDQSNVPMYSRISNGYLLLPFPPCRKNFNDDRKDVG